MELHPIPEAACIAFTRGGLILAVTRKGDERSVNFPGGKREPGESPEANARREVLEETGIELGAGALRLAFAGECEPEAGNPDSRVFWVECFWAELPEGIEPSQMEEGVRPEWLSLSEFIERSAFPAYNRKVAARLRELGWRGA